MQGKKLYVGNLNYAATNDEIKALFDEYGQVESVKIIEGKGFGFVEMSEQAEAEKAMEALNNTMFMGRTIKVDEARPPRKDRRDRPSGGGGGHRQGGYRPRRDNRRD